MTEERFNAYDGEGWIREAEAARAKNSASNFPTIGVRFVRGCLLYFILVMDRNLDRTYFLG